MVQSNIQKNSDINPSTLNLAGQVEPKAKPPQLRKEVMIVTLLLHVAALLAFVPGFFSWQAVGVALFLHWLTVGLGISLGFHRLASL